MHLLMFLTINRDIQHDRGENNGDRRRRKQNVNDEIASFRIVARCNRADIPDDRTSLVEIGRQDEQKSSFGVFFGNPANHLVIEIVGNHRPQGRIVGERIAGESPKQHVLFEDVTSHSSRCKPDLN